MTVSTLSTAAERAARHFDSNDAALARTQPWLRDLVTPLPADLEWVFGRDGALTALDGIGRWWSGCSVPLRAAESTLARMELTGAVGCFLLPPHAWHVHVVLRKLSRDRAIVVVEPDPLQLAVALRCVDLSREIDAHRVWFVTGADWPDRLRSLFEANPGLAIPTQFIRMPSSPAEEISRLVEPCTRAFQVANTARAALQRQCADALDPAATSLCVLGQSGFQLWNDAAGVLATTIGSDDVIRLNQDDPLNAGPLALAQAAARSRAVVTANLARSDLPSLVHLARPWITWITHARVPAPVPGATSDRLLLTDARWRAPALAAGWRAEQLRIADWPMRRVRRPRTARPIGIIADTLPLDCPDEKFELSSHTLLWRKIVHDLSNDPLQLRDDAPAFLDAQMKSLNIAPDGLDRRMFIEHVIVPAYQQGLAKLLVAAELPLMLAGSGWDALPEFASNWAGPIESAAQFHVAADACCAVVHTLPSIHRHRIDSLGLPVLRPCTLDRRGFIRDAKLALAGELSPAKVESPELSREFIEQMLIVSPSGLAA